jgi:hypothetical protein
MGFFVSPSYTAIPPCPGKMLCKYALAPNPSNNGARNFKKKKASRRVLWNAQILFWVGGAGPSSRNLKTKS